MAHKSHSPNAQKIWLIGGTSESIHLAECLVPLERSIVITVTQTSACKHYPKHPAFSVEANPFKSSQQLKLWIQDRHIGAILDASHPFAITISTQAMAIAQTLNIPYLRFERALSAKSTSKYVKEIDHWNTLFEQNYLSKQRVLLTTGSNTLNYFAHWHRKSELFARILPTESAIKAAMNAGFQRNHLIAFQPPLSLALECELWTHWNISLVVTKASGSAGGEDIKRQAAEHLQIPLLVLRRPSIQYTWQTDSITIAINFCKTVTLT